MAKLIYDPRKKKTLKDQRIWNDIYSILTKYGGFYNQTKATDELFSLTMRRGKT